MAVQYCNYDIKGTLAVDGASTLSGIVTITEATSNPLLNIYNTSSGNGATIKFSDVAGQSQVGNLTFYHADGSSQGGGASWHFVSQPDTVLVVGSGSVNGRFVAKSAGSVGEVDYGFYDDVNTGMVRTSADNVSLVAGGVAGIGVGSTAVSLKYAGTTKLTTLSTGVQVSGIMSATTVGLTNIVTNKIVKFNGSILDDSTMTDDGTNVTMTGDFTVQGGDITLGGTGRIQGVDTVSANTDAANKLYVDNAISGVPGESYINAATFSTGNGIITGTGVGSAGFTVDIDGRYPIGNVALQPFYIDLQQNPVGTTYGDGVSALPTYYFGQKGGDNDHMRFYAESAATNDITAVWEINDDLETGLTWLFRNKKTYSPFTATDALKIDGDGDVTVGKDLTITGGDIILSGTGRIQGVDTVSASTDAANKAYVDAHVSPAGTYLPLTGGTMSGNIAMGDNDITGIDQLIFTSGSYFDDVGSSNYIRLKYNTTTGGGLRVEDNAGHIGGYLYSDGSTTSSFGLLDGTGAWAVRCYENQYVELRYDNAAKFQTLTDGVYVAGKLGIGTSTPDADGYSFAEDLVIKGGASASDGAGITIASNGKRYGIIAFGDTADSNAGEIFYDHNVNAMYFRTDGSSSVVFINSAGKVTAGAATSSSDGSSTLTTKGYVDAQIATIPSGLNFQGNWNASTNSPTLTSGSGTPGFYYNVSVPGSTNLDGETDWQVGDWAVFVEAGATDKWEKIDNTSALTGTGVAGRVAYWDSTNNLTQDSDLTFNGSSLVVGGTVTAQTGNSVQWAEAYNNQITAISDSGSSTITLTLTQEDGGTLTTSFSNPQGTVTGTGSDNRLALWNGTTAIDSNAEFSISGNDFNIGTQAGTTAAKLLLYGTTANNGASVIKTTNGNLHIDSDDTHTVYLNYYTGGTTSVVIGNGASGSSGTVFYASGNATVGSNLDITTISNATSDTDKFLVADGARVKYRTGSQLLSDIGGAPATGGSYLPLAGGTMTTTGKIQFYNANQYIHASSSNDLSIASGDDINIITNYARFFNASVEHARLSSTTNSWIGNGTNSQVGINKANPSFNLDVEGTFRTTNNATVEGKLKVANRWDNSTLANNAIYAQNTTDGFAFGVGTAISTWFAWDSTAGQNDMISIANDGSKVTIYENLYLGNVDTSSNGTSALVLNSSGTGEVEKRTLGTGAFGPTPVGAYLPLAGGTLSGAFYAQGSLPTTSGMSGTGIGLGQASNYAHAQFSGSAGGYIDFAEPNVDYSGRIIYTHSSDSMVFYTATSVVLTLDSSNNATFAGDITVNGGDITLGGTGRIQGVDTVSAGTDAANKDYVDTAVAGSGSGTVTSVSSSTTSQLTVSQSSPAPALSIVTAAVANGGTALATGDQIYDATTTRLGSYLPLAGSVYDGNTGSWSNGITGNLALVSTSGTKGIFIGDDDNGAGQLSAQFNSNNGGGTLANNGGNLEIIAQNYGDGSDIIFKGNDTSNNLITYFQTVGASQKVRFIDNIKLTIGNGDDLQIYHDGSNSYINEAGTGSLVLKTGALLVRNPSDASMLDAQSGAAINLYYNGTKKFETTSAGVATPGSITVGSTGSAPLLFTKSTYGDFSTDAFYRIKFQDQGGVTNDVGIGQTATGNLGFNITAGKDFLFNGGTTGNALTLTSGGNATFAGDITLGASSSIVLDDTPTASTASGSGTIVNWSVSETVVAGSLYAVKTNGGWTLADADNENTAAYMLGIALGTNATQGMLLQGFFYKSGHGFTIGAPLYVSTTGGTFSNSRPTASNDYVRVIGYATSTNYIYFDPDKTWVKID